jgi:hypothetical protein
MSEVVKEAYKLRKRIEKDGIFVDPNEKEIRIHLSSYLEKPIFTYLSPPAIFSPAVSFLLNLEKEKNKKFNEMLATLAIYLKQKGFETVLEDKDTSYVFKIKKDEKNLFEIFREKGKWQIMMHDFRLFFISPYDELHIKNFNYCDESLQALDLILSHKRVNHYHQLYKKQRIIIGR